MARAQDNLLTTVLQALGGLTPKFPQLPIVDLGEIMVSPQGRAAAGMAESAPAGPVQGPVQPAMQGPVLPPVQGPMPLPAPSTPQEAPPVPGGLSRFLQAIMDPDLLVPAGAALAGTVAPGILPQAAGFSTGFTGERQRQKEQARQEEQDELDKIRQVVTLDEEGNVISKTPVGRDDIVKIKREGLSSEDLNALFFGGAAPTRAKFKPTPTSSQIGSAARQTATDAKGRKIFSDDGGQTWRDMQTKEIVK